MPAIALVDPDVAREAGRKLPKRKPDRTKPRTQGKRSLVSFMMSDSRLDKVAQARLRQAQTEGVTLQDIGAFALYTCEVARAGLECGELVLKDYVVALTKIASHLASAAQLAAQANPAAGGATVTVTFTGTGPTSTHPDCKPRPQPDPVIGDIIDADA